MTEISAMTTILRRMFSKKAFKPDIKPLAGIRKKMKFMEKDESVDNAFDAEDVSEFEGDFMNVGISHKMYEREKQNRKERLKQQIVVQKYFKEKEPRFLTFAEKELIHKLHNFNPEEWTIEKLSESFPALPETIRKILHAKWSPKSVKKVVEYDNVVKQNWEKFRMGKLPLSPILNEHLTKFKDRKIISTDRELLAKQFVSIPEFKKPKSQLFSNIVQIYLDEKQGDMKLSQEHNSSKLTDKSNHENPNLLTASTTINSMAVIKNTETFKLNKKLSSTSRIDSQKHDVPFNKKNEKLLTFDEFVKVKLEDINKESPEEGITLLNAYRKQVDTSQGMQSTEVATASDNAVIYPEEDAPSKIVRQSEKDVFIDSKDKDRNFNIIEADDNLLNTSITAWNKKVDVELDYAKPIKIAKHLYKPGMTYRISDCYYDDDGEFLYRVPNVHS